MNGRAITFDFHNTLAACPEWFELEVRTLPSAFLGWWAGQRGDSAPAEIAAEADNRYRALRRDIMEHGHELTAEACLAHVFAQMRLDAPDDAIRTGVADLMRDALAGASPIPGAVQTLRELHQTGTPIGVVSSAVYHPFLEWTLDAFGVRDALAVIVTSASAGYYKSRPEIFLHAAGALGAHPQRMVHVGDSLRFDVGGANSAGMGAVWLRHDGGRHADDAIAPDLTLDTLVSAAPRILEILDTRQNDPEAPVSEPAGASAPFAFDVFTIFPGIFAGPLDESILRRAQDRGIVSVAVHDIRDWAADKHRAVDDTTYGGGAGMVMMAPPIVAAVEETLGDELGAARVLVMSAAGRVFNQTFAEELAQGPRVAIVCGRYEGIDDRAVQILGAEEVSIGDYVLTGGELAAAVVIDAVSRLLPGVIDAASTAEESHREGLVEYPQYTRPPLFRGLDVPPILLSGHHAEIARWRREQSIRRTARQRPELLDLDALTPAERLLVEREQSH